MGLFTDGGISTSEDLRAYESSVLEVASTEGIELDAKFNLAAREIAGELSAYLVRRDPAGFGVRDKSNVVVTDSLADWHRLLSLSLVYRDSYNSQLNDRYLGKWKEYSALALKARGTFLDIGIGLTSYPVPKAADPICVAVNGGTLLESTYSVQIVWQNNRGDVGSPSNLVTVTTPDGTLLSVAAPGSPASTLTWSVFVGHPGTVVKRQNSNPVAPGATWVMPISGLQDGPQVAADQLPDYYITRESQLRRG